MKLKNVTLSADEHLIELARQKAQYHHISLNQVFRQWLARYVGQNDAAVGYDNLMKRLSYVKAGKHFTRDELNER